MTGDLPGRLETAVAHLNRRPPTAPLAARLQELHGRLSAGRFHLAVLGQFKRGKSTLLNALLGEPLLPTAVIPVTAVPTLIAHGPALCAQIVFQDGRAADVPPAELARYVSETDNPHNRLGVARVEVRCPARLLAQGVVLIDTPGVGSTLAHNTAATLDFLPEVDAALFLLSADPPITAAELEFLQAVRQRVKRLFFLLNKVDHLTAAEQALALAFAADTLRRQAHWNDELTFFPISARQALEARQQGDADGWRRSGLADLEAHLLRFLDQEKQIALEQAIRAKAADALREAQQLLQTERRALTMPLDELQHKRQIFQEALVAARRQRRQAADLLQADQQRLVEEINQRAANLRRSAEQELAAAAETAVAQTADLETAEQAAEQQLAETAAAFFTAHYPPFSQHLQADVTALLSEYARQADALVEELRRLAADLFAFAFVPLNPDEPPTRLQTPYWVRSVLPTGLGLTAAPGLWERLLPPARRRARILNRLRPSVGELALRNAEHLRWAVVQNTQDVMRRFQTHLDTRWQEAIEATGLALETAAAQRAQQAAAGADALAELDDLIHAVHALSEELSAQQPSHSQPQGASR